MPVECGSSWNNGMRWTKHSVACHYIYKKFVTDLLKRFYPLAGQNPPISQSRKWSRRKHLVRFSGRGSPTGDDPWYHPGPNRILLDGWIFLAVKTHRSGQVNNGVKHTRAGIVSKLDHNETAQFSQWEFCSNIKNIWNNIHPFFDFNCVCENESANQEGSDQLLFLVVERFDCWCWCWSWLGLERGRGLVCCWFPFQIQKRNGIKISGTNP